MSHCSGLWLSTLSLLQSCLLSSLVRGVPHRPSTVRAFSSCQSSHIKARRLGEQAQRHLQQISSLFLYLTGAPKIWGKVGLWRPHPKQGRKAETGVGTGLSAARYGACMASKLCAGAEQRPELSHEANRMTEVNMTKGSQRHTCRNGKD